MSVGDSAQEYLRHGLSVIPVMPGSKVPAVGWTEFQKRIATSEEAHNWFLRRNLNLGLVTGTVSGIAVVDVDPKHGGDPSPYMGATDIVARTPSGGWHFYFGCGAERVKTGTDRRPGVDVRGEGGFVVAPPSKRDDGTYSWVGESFTRLLAREFSRYDEAHLFPPKIAAGPAESKAITENWITEALNGVGEGARNDTCTRLSGYLLDKHPKDVAWGLIEAWTQRCHPPMAIEEARATFESIATREESKRSGPAPVTAVSVNDYLALNYTPAPREWLVPGLVPCGSVIMVAGAPRSFKSMLTTDLAGAIALGRPFLGRPTKQGPVILLQLEDPPYELAQRLAAALDVVPDCSDGDFSRPARPSGAPLYVDKAALFRLEDKKAARALREQVAQLRPSLLVVDPFYLICSAGAAADYFAGMPQAIKYFAALRDDFGVTTVLVHHTRKMSKEDQRNGQQHLTADDVYGSALVNASVEGVILLKRPSGTNQVEVVSNLKAGGADLEPHSYEVVYTGTRPLEVVEHGLAAVGTHAHKPTPAANVSLTERILAQANGTTVNVRTLAASTRASRPEVMACIEVLLLQKKLEKVGRGTYVCTK